MCSEGGSGYQRTKRLVGRGLGVLDECSAEMAPFLIERGAVVDAHAAARLGMLERLQELVAENPEVVHARGGDGQTPLHSHLRWRLRDFCWKGRRYGCSRYRPRIDTGAIHVAGDAGAALCA